MPRPKGEPTKVVRLPARVVDRIDEEAERNGLSRAEVVEGWSNRPASKVERKPQRSSLPGAPSEWGRARQEALNKQRGKK